MNLNADTEIDLDIEIFEERLYVSPAEMPAPRNKQLRRLNEGRDFALMNDPRVHEFFYSSLHDANIDRSVDFTDLVIGHTQEISPTRISTDKDLQRIKDLWFCDLEESMRKFFVDYPLNYKPLGFSTKYTGFLLGSMPINCSDVAI
jgi:hypothetical protein